MDKKIKPNARKSNLVIQETGDEVLLYDLVTNKATCLNETSAFVWQNCNGENGISDIAAALGRKTNQQVNEEFIWLAIDQLSKSNLLEEKVQTEVFSGLSRRDVIKKVGLGAMIALPIVSTLVAPKAAHAASSCMVGGTCTCNAASGGMSGQICTASTPCGDTNCRCAWANNGNANGTCVA